MKNPSRFIFTVTKSKNEKMGCPKRDSPKKESLRETDKLSFVFVEKALQALRLCPLGKTGGGANGVKNLEVSRQLI